MRGTLEELATSCRTISYSLSGDIGSGRRNDPDRGFENYAAQLDEVLDGAGLGCSAVCGVSFGGLVALHYAALRPERVSALVLVSAPGPGWNPSDRQTRWLASPWLSAPLVAMSAPLRMWPEIRSALPGAERLRFSIGQTLRCAAAPMVPPLMSRRVRDAARVDFMADCRRVHAPTLVIAGEESLDQVVPVRSTRAYATAIDGAAFVTLDGTGHLGLLTQPKRFAALVSEFVHAYDH
jgi:pimeloyl-ACP methyl ester carboxylesterase